MEDLVKIVFSIGIFLFYIWRSFNKQQQDAKQRQRELSSESAEEKRQKWEELFDMEVKPKVEVKPAPVEIKRKSFLYKDKYNKRREAISLEKVNADYFKNLQNDSDFEMQRMMLDDEQHEEDYRSDYIRGLISNFKASPADAIIYDAILKPKYLQ
ncbi:MAG TPA: hypothetical protein PKH65_01850 [Bacteroidia bacterium]|nr:hypothetical protein [Bacteroidia bacterium]